MDNIVVPANVPKDESVAPTTLEDDGLNAPIAVQQDISSAIDEAVTPMTTTTGDELLDLESLSRSKHQPKIESTKIPDIVDTVVEGPASINNQDDDWTMGFAPRKRRLPKYEPIKFKDAVGRQYSFPFHTVRTWIGMEELIKQIFKQIAILSAQVNAGRYDLVGPPGAIILPSVWEELIAPGWSITMHMWPSLEPPQQAVSGPSKRPPTSLRSKTRFLPSEVLNFPEFMSTSSEQSLHLVLFHFIFSDSLQHNRIVANCKLSSPAVYSSEDQDFVVLGMSFFQPPDSGVGLEQVRTKDSAFLNVKANCDLFGSAGDHVLAVLIQKRRSRSSAQCSVDIDFTVQTKRTLIIVDRSKRTALIDHKFVLGLTPFSWALSHGWESAVKLLLERPQVLLNLRYGKGESALLWAAKSGHMVATQSLLEAAGSQVNEGDQLGRTAFSWAAGQGHLDVVSLLRQSKQVDINRPDNFGRTPLSWAAEGNQPDIVRYLLQYADVDADRSDRNGMTPLSWAVDKACYDVVAACISHMEMNTGINNLVVDSDEPICSPMSIAAGIGNQVMLKKMFKEQWRQSKTSQYKILRKHHGWLLEVFQLHKAAANGWDRVIRLILNDWKISADSLDPEFELTPLCVAARGGHLKVVSTLLEAKANPNFETRTTRDTPLGLAIRSGSKELVELLINAGVKNFSRLRNARGESPRDLAAQSSLEIFNMVAALDVAGQLGKMEDLHPVDHEFKATIIDFVESSTGHDPKVTEICIDELLANPLYSVTAQMENITTVPSLRWLHLPANNMQWVECLVTNLYVKDLASAYKVLDPERWEKRQHHGAGKTHHARFMRPHCEQFPTVRSFGSSAETHMNLVLFMPFLHWDVESLRQGRESTAEMSPNNKKPEWSRERRLLKAYLKDDHSPLHVRRTLDQYYYHTLQSTNERDLDQVVTRYQDKKGLGPKVITMVDQLWLWVLEGVANQPATVISCFPEVGDNDPSNVEIIRNLDPGNQTKVLEQIKHHLLSEPRCIQNPYDLAGLIAATCSRLYLNPASILSISNEKYRWGLQFSELYQTEISDIAEEEAKFFKDFTSAGNDQAVNIKYEIDLLSRIKDVLDELQIMNMLFGDQLKVLKVMDDIVRSTDIPKQSPGDIFRQEILKAMKAEQSSSEASFYSTSGTVSEDESDDEYKEARKAIAEATAKHEAQERVAKEAKKEAELKAMKEAEVIHKARKAMENKTKAGTIEEREALELQEAKEAREAQEARVLKEAEETERAQETKDKEDKNPSKASNVNTRAVRPIWGTKDDRDDFSMPLAKVVASSDEIRAMIERAENVKEALTFLVDLKQKQNDVIDSKTSIEQGRIVLIFTITTIIFLPVSFMTSFFTINIRQFRQDANGQLDLGYVSYIIFPISTIISATLIWIAFKYHTISALWEIVKKLSRPKTTGTPVLEV